MGVSREYTDGIIIAVEIIKEKTTIQYIKKMAEEGFGNFVKAVVDISQGIMAVGGELHADEEALLIKNGSKQSDLWGINIYPDIKDEEQIEFDSMINIRPAQGNRSRSVENPETRALITKIVSLLITK